jgi:hypothetical protein
MDDSNGNGHLRHQLRLLGLLPLIIFVWIIGWTLSWIGNQNVVKNCQKERHNVFRKKDYKRSDVKEESLKQILT